MKYALCFLLLPAFLQAQEKDPAVPVIGTVIFQKGGETMPPDAADTNMSAASGITPASQKTAPDAEVSVSDAERDAISFTAYDLDLHLTPATSGLEAHVNFTVRNDSTAPLRQVAVQISSSLVWESLALRSATPVPAKFVQHRITTDADHSGTAREAVLTLQQQLAPGASLDLSAFYTGSIPVSAERLERIGAPANDATAADWDRISSEDTALRGYGNVLWYPVSSAPVFLGDGAKLFESAGLTRLRQQAAKVRLRLTISYVGDAPNAAFFCGRREPLAVLSENDGLPVAEAPGIATAEFPSATLGFRIPSLFITGRAATITDGGLLRAVTDQGDALSQYVAAAAKAQPLLIDWLGSSPLAPLDLLDHAGQSFEDGPLLVTPLTLAEPKSLAPILVHTLAHSWFSSSFAWLDEGVAQFLSLLWVETNDGRQAGLDRLQAAASVLALAEPTFTRGPVSARGGTSSKQPELAASQSLLDAHSEVYYRTKAAAVLWMLRAITSDDAVKSALQLYRHNHAADVSRDGFEKLIEQTSHQDLRWFFDDWVNRDLGLPDLSIANIAPRQLPDQGVKSGGWLVAVTVRNDGDAVAEVPVTVRSGSLTATERLRVLGRSSAATRILFQGTPEEVLVNDGSIPEVVQSIHSRKIVLQAH